MALLSSDECRRIVLLVARPESQVRTESRGLEIELDVHCLPFYIESVPRIFVKPSIQNEIESSFLTCQP